MWKLLGERIVQYRVVLLTLLLLATVFMGWEASGVKLSYEFAKSIPTDNPKYVAYQQFRQQFGEDGNLLVIGIQTPHFFDEAIFNDYRNLQQALKEVKGVTDVLSVPGAITLVKDEATERLNALPLFPQGTLTQVQIDSGKTVFLSLPFYKGLLYNPQTSAWLMGVHVDAAIMNSPKRTAIVNNITQLATAFGNKHGIDIHLSGLPLIRTVLANRIQKEMKWFTLASILLSAVILLLFFRSVSTTLLALSVVIIGVIWGFGILQLLGYKITLLTALIPPLIVVIGIPNCIYFLNKYHTAFRDTGGKHGAIVQMVAKMGIVTLFCNVAAAIGFAVFALTKSAILKEFGAVAGISIMLLFFISLILIPTVVSLMPAPKEQHTKYLDNKWLQSGLDKLEYWALHHRMLIFSVTGIVLIFSVMGMLRLKSVGYIVDDLPKTDKVYTDLKFFEEHFKGVMPLEILVDTKKKYGVTRNLKNLLKIDSLVQYLAAQPYIGKPLSITEGLKFAKQAFFEGDSTNYTMPSEYDLPALAQYLSMKGGNTGNNSFTKLVSSFMDSSRQQARISVSMKDVGSARLPLLLDSIQKRADGLFPKDQYKVQLTGSSVTFLEGSRFIINGLRESILWAFLLIALCMLYLFKSLRILLCSLLPNIIPLVITAGVMGWTGVALKPSTVLVFSVALGIAIDITIRFLVNYNQELKASRNTNPQQIVIQTIHSTGLSIIYTSIVLIAGFVIFVFSSFGGTQALGWLTSLTLLTATLANLIFLPALLIVFVKKQRL